MSRSRSQPRHGLGYGFGYGFGRRGFGRRGFVSLVRCHPSTTSALPAIVELRRSWTEESIGRPTDDIGFEGRLGDWLGAEGRLMLLAECSAERAVAECSAERAVAECSAERAGEALGMVNLAIFERMPSPERAYSRWAYLANAYVRPEHRDRGRRATSERASGQPRC